jgi:hypothetical protein
MMIKCTIQERGNGLPSVDDYVPGDDGNLYRVTAVTGRIQTGQPGIPHSVPAEVVLVDWLDCDEEDEYPAMAIIPQEDDEEES